jgi:polysaccharide export outer membrane protein
MRRPRFLVLLTAALLAAGCARQPVAPMAAASSSDLDTLAYSGRATSYAATPQETAYTLDSGDKLRVVVYGQDGLTNSYAVDAGGNITMPLIGSVKARGLSTAQLSTAVAGKLRQGYMREPYVAVEIESYRPFFILGEVAFPGQYPYVANMTVETAVAIAGGFSPRAERQTVEISRPVRGELTRRSAPVATPVKPGDTIVVAERWF